MGEEKKVVDYCASCKEYVGLIREYTKGLVKGDYNSWQGLGLALENACNESELMDEEIVKALGPICENCDTKPGIYTRRDLWVKVKEDWDERNDKLSQMPPEEINDYLRKHFRGLMLEITVERFVEMLGKVFKP